MPSIKQILSRPYPPTSHMGKRLRMAALFGLFVFLFLWVFQPFGLSGAHGPIWLITLGYGIITFAAMAVPGEMIIAVLPGLYDEDNWTAGKEIIHTLFIILVIALGNFFYSVAMGFSQFSLGGFIAFLAFTLAVGIFPVAAYVFVRQGNLSKRAEASSHKLSEGLGQVQNPAETRVKLEDEEFRVALELASTDLLCIESADNYVQVYFQEGGQLKRELIRNKLGFFESELEFLYRCHRSYLINLSHVIEVKGNARGYRIKLHPTLPSIPVARRRSQEFEKMLRSHSPQPVTT